MQLLLRGFAGSVPVTEAVQQTESQGVGQVKLPAGPTLLTFNNLSGYKMVTVES